MHVRWFGFFRSRVQFSKLAWVTKILFCLILWELWKLWHWIKSITCHLWRDLTAFYFRVKTRGKFEVLGRRNIKQLIPYRGAKAAQRSFQKQDFNIKTHKKITNYPRQYVKYWTVQFLLTETLQWTLQHQLKLYMHIIATWVL